MKLKFSCIALSHNKPKFLPDAIQSVLNQSYPIWELLLIDSGVLYDQGFYQKFPWYTDPRIRIYRSQETEQLRKTKTIASWCFNEMFRNKLVQGELVMYLCDDDLLYPNAFETFVNYSQANPNAQAMYASQDYGWINENGQSGIMGERRAIDMAGKCCNGTVLHCKVDYLQFCHKRSVIENWQGNEWWPESLQWKASADGVFMELIGMKTPIYPIDIKVGLNRRTPQSINIPMP